MVWDKTAALARARHETKFINAPLPDCVRVQFALPRMNSHSHGSGGALTPKPVTMPTLNWLKDH